MKKTSLLFILLLSAVAMVAQDKHFSQFYSMPLTLNPALTGTMPGKYRAAVIYRNQWQTIMDQSFKTIAGAFDIRLPIGLKKSDAIGAGVLFFSDKGGIGNYSTNQLAVTAAFHKSLGFRKSQYLSAGFSMGLSQRNVNYDALSFNDQFDGESGYTLSTDEPLPDNNFSYGDLAAGIHFSSEPERNKSIHAGVSVFHANLPNVTSSEDFKERLAPLITLHLSGHLPVSRKIVAIPRLLGHYQGPNLEINAGANFKYLLSDYSGTSMYLGLMARPVLDVESGIAVDAIILLAAFEVESLRFGFSYDSNISKLIKSSSSFGAFELSVIFTGKNENEGVLCPTF